MSTLEIALNSAINQIGFDDYEILVADNEGADLNIETETEQFIKKLNSTKVIYYRHNKTISYVVEHAIRLARTKWICVLHDDDILAADALLQLSKIVKENPGITWLSGEVQSFQSSKEQEIVHCASEVHTVSRYKLLHYPKQYSATGYVPGWLGAFINRENYISMGGMPGMWLGCGDYMMQGKYSDRYGTYACKLGFPLYYYRIWEGQLSANGSNEWFNNYIEQFLYYRFLAGKYHPFTGRFWEYIGWHIIQDAINNKNSGFYQCKIDKEEIRLLLNIPKYWSRRGLFYKMSNLILLAYRKYWTEKTCVERHSEEE